MSIGPSMPLRLEKPEGIDLAQAARYFGARGGADAATQALLEKCAVPLLAAATPRAVWLEADPDSLTAAGILAGEDVAKHLEGCTAALLLAVTLGPGVDAQIRRAGVGDIAAGVASDALGSALAEQVAEAAEAELRQWAARQGKYLTGRYSPGYGDWPLAVQPLLAAALDTARTAGVPVCFVPSLRPALWPSEKALRDTVMQFLPFADILVLTADEMKLLLDTREYQVGLFALLRGHTQLVVLETEEGVHAFTRAVHAFRPGLSAPPEELAARLLYQISQQELTLKKLMKCSAPALQTLL